MHKPWHSLIFGVSVFLTLGLLSFTFPKTGVRINDSLTLNFPGLDGLFAAKKNRKDISKIIEAIDAIDTTFTFADTLNDKEAPDGTAAIGDSSVKLNTGLQFRNRAAMSSFFEALNGLKANPRSIRVLHYGDSQIEGDRITDYLRLKLQGQFGGQGVGLVSLTPIAASVISKITVGPDWDRYTVFTVKDKRVMHTNYGVLGGFSRYREYTGRPDSSSAVTSSITITTTRFGGTTAMAYKKLKLFYGGARYKTWTEFYDGPALMSADSLDAGGFFRIREYNVGQGSNTHTLKFSGKDSPDFYAISLESESGVMVDNIALRGSSGTFFHLINPTQLKQFYDHLNVKLIILQFGGNAMPAIKDATMAANYAGYMKYQIATVKKLAPGASILFIGPSDMSIKQGTDYVTYPYLEDMRDALKKVVLESDCAFFDMYDCMGGRNSMASWVDQKLAATDYTHFSPQGARKMATLLYSALIKEYNNYLKTRQ